MENSYELEKDTVDVKHLLYIFVYKANTCNKNVCKWKEMEIKRKEGSRVYEKES